MSNAALAGLTAGLSTSLKWEVWPCSSEKLDVTLMTEQHATPRIARSCALIKGGKKRNYQIAFPSTILSALYPRLSTRSVPYLGGLGWGSVAGVPRSIPTTEGSGSIPCRAASPTRTKPVSRCLLLPVRKDREVTGAFSIPAFRSIAKKKKKITCYTSR